MKKFLSVLLAAMLLVSVFALNAAAVNVVGTHGQSGGVSDGVADIPEGASTSGDVVLNLGTVNHRYAVDVTFPTMTFEVGGLTWNVNTMKYESGGTTMSDQTLTITITNYSDLPVNAEGTVGSIAEAATSAGISLAMTTASATVAQATAGSADTNGTAATATLEASLTSGNWTNSIDALFFAGAQSITVGTITVAISKTE